MKNDDPKHGLKKINLSVWRMDKSWIQPKIYIQK